MSEDGDEGYVLFLWTPGGYELREEDGEPPAVGTELVHKGRKLVVSKLASSPLPGDERPCAYTVGRS